MTGRFLKFFSALRYYLALALMLTAFVPSLSFASACTAMWAVTGANQLAYYNTSTNKWVLRTAALTQCTGVSGCNALAGRNSNALLYFVNRATRDLYTYNPNTDIVSASLGIIPSPPPAVSATNILGATFDNSDRLFVYATDGTLTGSTNGFVVTAQISVANAATLTSWTQVKTTAGATATLAGSGDMNIGNDGITYMITNTNPPTYHQINLTPGASFGQTTSPPLTITGANGVSVTSVGVNPVTQGASPDQIYFSSNVAASATYVLNRSTGVATLVDSEVTINISDMGNCPIPPDPPTVIKTLTPGYQASGTNTATLNITFGNTNTAPFWLMSTFSDVFPTGMVIGPVPSQAGSCVTPTNTITTTAGSNSVTFAAGGKIPMGGCTLSFTISATAALAVYTNTIAIGSLTTTAGSNTTATSATYQVGTDFSTGKTQGTSTTGPYTSSTLTVPGGTTMQYILTVTNSSSGGTGSATFTDTLPSLITPVLTITSAMVGGGAGTCVTTSTVSLTSATTQITGTMTNVIAGAVCTITVTAKVSVTQTVATIVTNTFTLAPLTGTSDTNPANNSATVTTSVGASANITISKTNGTTTVLAGSTNAYTVTIANLGPASAQGAVFLDPIATGIGCTTVTFTSTPVGSVTVQPSPLTLSALQSTGITFTPTFPALSTAAFRITCGVTATGQ